MANCHNAAAAKRSGLTQALGRKWSNMETEGLYARALGEFESGQADRELAARALVKADGDEAKVKVEYVKLRVAQLQAGSLTNPLPSIMRQLFTVAPPADDTPAEHRAFVLRAMGRLVLVCIGFVIILVSVLSSL